MPPPKAITDQQENRWRQRILLAKEFDILYKVSKVCLFINPYIESNEMKAWNPMTFPWPEHMLPTFFKTFPGLESKFRIPWVSLTFSWPREPWYGNKELTTEYSESIHVRGGLRVPIRHFILLLTLIDRHCRKDLLGTSPEVLHWVRILSLWKPRSAVPPQDGGWSLDPALPGGFLTTVVKKKGSSLVAGYVPTHPFLEANPYLTQQPLPRLLT